MDHLRLDAEVKFSSDKTGVFSGYGAIVGNVDAGGDQIQKGAFTDTLRAWEGKGKWPPMLLQHGGGFLGSADDALPIGKWTSMEENAKGLKVEGELFGLSTERGTYIYEGMKAGALDGLSIGYRAKKFTMGTKVGEPRRKLEAIDLIELSVVTFPMNDKSRISGVKAGDIKTVREFEDFLRDVGGFSHSAAKSIASGGYKAVEPRDEAEAAEDLMASIRRNIQSLQPK